MDQKLGKAHEKHSGETEHMDYLEFIARVISHIPDKGQVMICYYRSPQSVQQELLMAAEERGEYF